MEETVQPLPTSPRAADNAHDTDMVGCPLPDFLREVCYPTAPDHTAGRMYYEPPEPSQLIIASLAPDAANDALHETPNFASWPYPSIHLPKALADMYEAERCSHQQNHEAAKITVATSLNIPDWDQSATGHKDDEWILGAVRYGFPIQYSGPSQYETIPLYNQSSAKAHANVVCEYIRKETQPGTLHGPFDAPPFVPWMFTSPLMTREKPDSKERRVIVDLSYPDGGVNQHIHPH